MSDRKILKASSRSVLNLSNSTKRAVDEIEEIDEEEEKTTLRPPKKTSSIEEVDHDDDDEFGPPPPAVEKLDDSELGPPLSEFNVRGRWGKPIATVIENTKSGIVIRIDDLSVPENWLEVDVTSESLIKCGFLKGRFFHSTKPFDEFGYL